MPKINTKSVETDFTAIAISGTPGTGKSAVARVLVKRLGRLSYKLYEIYDFARERKLIRGYDKVRKSYVVDIKGLRRESARLKGKENVIFVGHMSHFCDADFVFVLRTRPDVLRIRLKRKGWSKAKIAENIEAEILDVCLQEAVAEHGLRGVFEIDTTKKKEKQVAQIILNILKGIKEERQRYKPGKIDWTSYLK